MGWRRQPPTLTAQAAPSLSLPGREGREETGAVYAQTHNTPSIIKQELSGAPTIHPGSISTIAQGGSANKQPLSKDGDAPRCLKVILNMRTLCFDRPIIVNKKLGGEKKIYDSCSDLKRSVAD